MSGTSYDERMEGLPVLISYGRSGSGFLNNTLETYFQRPKLRISLDSLLSEEYHNNEPIYFHDHDEKSDLELKHENIAYLVRDPTDVIFSILKARQDEINDGFVKEEIVKIKKHHEKYLNNKLVISYHEIVSKNPFNAFKSFINFIDSGVVFDVEKLKQSFAKKESIIQKARDKRFYNNYMLSKDYEKERQKFIKTYSNIIKGELYSPLLIKKLKI